ncbi:hypothetical protein [Rickettsia endosymbiont of Cardiosporidium cionae]|uniref:hypothetical protein n=1 Tax=Rickettsia endosymbiont of Cardiosporidium cionae TaxID=2777155 RepID=UPI001895784B|nr:hypothetical protein [Rickettsia endosymbiont of Cardiosporidium cionae]KAF8818797.1 hypothetical protein IHI24_000031 [Rickettsia endosymbiont of Cardiosporidium cionae]
MKDILYSTTQSVDKIEKLVDSILDIIKNQDKKILELQLQNQQLTTENKNIKNKVKEYITELKQIRAFYANHHNNTRK